MRDSVSEADKNDLREIALDGMEERPEYFGALPAPTETPYGYTTNGVFGIQTDCAETALAVAYPVWDDIFSPFGRTPERG